MKVKKLMDQLADDLNTKIILLNEKRVQDLSYQLADYTKSFSDYFINCSQIIEDTDIQFTQDSTAEFKSLLSSDEKVLF